MSPVLLLSALSLLVGNLGEQTCFFGCVASRLSVRRVDGLKLQLVSVDP